MLENKIFTLNKKTKRENCFMDKTKIMIKIEENKARFSKIK